jgi:hypothetical protein
MEDIDRMQTVYPKERIRMLERLKELRGEEIKTAEAKLSKEIKELEEKRRKEIKELETKLKKENDDINSDIIQSMLDLRLEERRRFLEDETRKTSKTRTDPEVSKYKKELWGAINEEAGKVSEKLMNEDVEEPKREISLDEALRNVNVASANVPSAGIGDNFVYNVMERMANRESLNFYELTNYNLYNRVKELSEKAGDAPLSREERMFVEGLAYNMNKISQHDEYQSSNIDRNNYMSRTSSLLEKMSEDFEHFNRTNN